MCSSRQPVEIQKCAQPLPERTETRNAVPAVTPKNRRIPMTKTPLRRLISVDEDCHSLAEMAPAYERGEINRRAPKAPY